MSEIRESVFALDLPGEWESAQTSEPGAVAYRQLDGPATLTVMALSVRPLFSIADRARLLADYSSHRAKFERGQTGTLEYSEPIYAALGDAHEARWSGFDPSTGLFRGHRTLLWGGLLVDFCFESPADSAQEFDELAGTALSGATITPPPAE